MEDGKPKANIEFGSDESLTNFKSSFARSVVCHHSNLKSLHNGVGDLVSDEKSEANWSIETIRNDHNSTFDLDSSDDNRASQTTLVLTTRPAVNEFDVDELNHLRKQCQILAEQNQHLQKMLKSNGIRVMDTVLLQNEVETLNWKLQQMESNQNMQKSLMRQVVAFLDRAKNSLDYIAEKDAERKKRSPYHSQSLSIDETSSNGSTAAAETASTSNSTHAKSAAQIPKTTSSGFREFTRSVFRRNDSTYSTPLKVKSDKKPKENLNKTYDGVVYRYPDTKDNELENENYVPPAKLSQEAFRLMRTVQSLIVMRDPDLVTLSSSSFSPILTSESDSPVSCPHDCIADDDNNNMSLGKVHDDASECANSPPLSGISLEDMAFHPVTGEFFDNDARYMAENDPKRASQMNSIRSELFTRPGASTPKPITKKTIRSNRPTSLMYVRPKKRLDSENEFLSLNSFHDVGLPRTTIVSPTSGCHTESNGSPVVSFVKKNCRRWSTTPVEIQTFLRKCSNGFMSNKSNVDSLSVWV